MGYRNYSVANGFTVDPSGNGDFTTIGAALTAAVAGDTIFLRPGTYTENPTLKAGVNLSAFPCDAYTPSVIINGKCTATFTGTCSLSGIQLQTNSDFCLVVSGTNTTNVNLKGCYVYALNNTAINYTTSGGGKIQLFDCKGDTGTSGVAYFTNSSTNGAIKIFGGTFENDGASTTASTVSGSGGLDIVNAIFLNNISTSSSTGIQLGYCSLGSVSVTGAGSVQAGWCGIGTLTLAGTGTSLCEECQFTGGASSAITVGSGTTLQLYGGEVSSSNTNAITGAGTLSYGGVIFTGSSSTINVTTQTPVAWTVQQGGTAASSFTAYAPIVGGTTTTGAFQSASTGIGTANFVLLSNGASAVPSFQTVSAAGAVTTIDGDSGSATPTAGVITFSAVNCGAVGAFTGSSSSVSLSFTDANNNTFLGLSSGKSGATGTGNTCIGYAALSNLSSSIGNTCLGDAAGQYINTGAGNNTVVGYQAFNHTGSTGAYNTLLGAGTGVNYTSSESSNILIGYNTQGTVSESNVLRIGNATGTSTGNINAAFIQGISGTTVTGTAVLCSTAGQLGTIASSQRYKENIVPMSPKVSVLDLTPVEFNYIADEKKEKRYGLIAEEVHEKFPYLCFYNEEGKPESVMYHELPALLLHEIKKLKEEIENLKQGKSK